MRFKTVKLASTPLLTARPAIGVSSEATPSNSTSCVEPDDRLAVLGRESVAVDERRRARDRPNEFRQSLVGYDFELVDRTTAR